MEQRVAGALQWLREHSTARDRDNLVRFGINAQNALGVSMANMHILAKQLGRNHDLACFALFDRSPHAWSRVEKWSRKKDEFGKRAAFALLASLALHDKKGPDRPFLEALPLIEAAATDERNFVKKGVSWALRSMARRGPDVAAAATELAERLAASPDRTSRWIGKEALREYAKLKVRKAAKG